MACRLFESRPARTVGDRYFRDCYPGFKLSNYIADASSETLTIELEAADLCVCLKCGARCKAHHSVLRVVKDAPKDGYPTVYVRFRARQVECSCGCRRMEAIPWLEPHARVTNRLIAYVQANLREGDTVKAVAQRYGLDWTTVRMLDKRQLDYCFSTIELLGLKHLIMDEFAISKGQHYATIVMDAETHRAVWVGRGRGGKDVRPFFEALKEHGVADKILSVSMDMNACFPSLVYEYCPNAVVLYDLFHVLQLFTREVLVPAKKRCQKDVIARLAALDTPKGTTEPLSPEQLKSNAELRAQLKAEKSLYTSAQWVLVRSFDDLENDDFEKLDKLRKTNQLLSDLYPISDLLRNLWREKNMCEAIELIERIRAICLAVARTHKFEPARSFAKMLKRRFEGIIHCGRFGYGSGPLEGANNAIKVLKRDGYGYRDFEYFKKKVLARLPGKAPTRSSIRFSMLRRTVAVTKAGFLGCCFPTNPR